VAALKNRQMKHISAEQKRRFNIKMGFDTLNSLISNNSKLTSHAITLQKTVEYITKLQQERGQMQEEARRLREEIEELNATIISCQQLLPATGVPVTRHQFDHMRDMFDEYVKSRTLQNWKFWIVSLGFLCFSHPPQMAAVEFIQQAVLVSASVQGPGLARGGKGGCCW